MFIARFTAAGDPDTAFSRDGLLVVPFAKCQSYAYGVAMHGAKIYATGQVYTSGTSVSDVVVVRLTGAGVLDPTFGAGGKKLYDLRDGVDGADWADAIRWVGNGRLVLAGASESIQGYDTLVMRILADGRVDRSFKGRDESFMNLRKGGSDLAHDLVTDGAKLVVGVFGVAGKPILVRLRSDGSRDPTFGNKGVGRYSIPAFSLLELACDANHRVMAAGYSGHLPVFRVRPNGVLATGFGTAGVAANEDTSAIGTDVMLQSGGLILVAGAVQNISVNATRYLP
jgi:uncharacterized delta-60 repeat protein